MLPGGNAVVFNTHPRRGACPTPVHLLNEAIVAAGGPENLICSVAEPTIESAQALMKHPHVRILAVTGGPGVVKEAINSGKRAISAGPGNPPAVVDETAHLERPAGTSTAARSTTTSSAPPRRKCWRSRRSRTGSFARWRQNGAYVLAEHELRRLERVIFTDLGAPGKPGHMNPAWIGRDAARILAEIGVRPAVEPRLLVAEVPAEHSLVWTEQMMPVLPVVRVPDVGRGDRPGRPRGARVPPHGVDPLHQRGDDHPDGAGDELLDLRRQRAQLLRASARAARASRPCRSRRPSGDGMTRPRTFSRERRITVVGALRIV